MALRKRFGVMVPSTNTTCEADFQMVAPRGYTVHGQRLWLTNDALGEEGMLRMNGEIESGARYLATAHVDAVSYGCTTGSFFKGPGWDREMIDLIERTAGVPAVATSPSVVEALRYAESLSDDVRAVYVDVDTAATDQLRREWNTWGGRVKLIVLASPFRSMMEPLLEYIEQVQKERPDDYVTVILPEFVPARWWQHLLHNQRALLIKGALLFRPNVVVTSVPFHLTK